jgi:hypothetical protein
MRTILTWYHFETQQDEGLLLLRILPLSTIKNTDNTTSAHHCIDNMDKSCAKLVKKKHGIYLVLFQTKYFQCVHACVCVCVCVCVCYIPILLNKNVSVQFKRISKQ